MDGMLDKFFSRERSTSSSTSSLARQLVQAAEDSRERSTVPAFSFAGLSNLYGLYMNYNNISAIEIDSFSNLNPNLVALYLGFNNISSVAPGTFASLAGLQTLSIDNNQLEVLQAGVFRGLNNLNDLVLRDNRLTNFSRNLFRDLVNLKSLHLEQNEITTLEPGTFEGLSQLTQLFLDRNKLSHIVLGAFSGLPELRVLSLTYNYISTVDDGANGIQSLTKLEILNANGNNNTEALKRYVQKDQGVIKFLDYDRFENEIKGNNQWMKGPPLGEISERNQEGPCSVHYRDVHN